MNALSFRKVIQWTFAGLLVAAGVGFFYGAVVAAPGEPAGCANDTCKEITFWISCDANKVPEAGIVYDRLNCLPCKQANGRCENGTTKKCEETTTPIMHAPADVKEICLCANAPASGRVEGSLVEQKGKFKDTGFKQWICK